MQHSKEAVALLMELLWYKHDSETHTFTAEARQSSNQFYSSGITKFPTLSFLQHRCSGCYLVTRKHFSALLHFYISSESHWVYRLESIPCNSSHTAQESLIHSRNKKQHNQHPGRCRYASGHLTSKLCAFIP